MNKDKGLTTTNLRLFIAIIPCVVLTGSSEALASDFRDSVEARESSSISVYSRDSRQTNKKDSIASMRESIMFATKDAQEYNRQSVSDRNGAVAPAGVPAGGGKGFP